MTTHLKIDFVSDVSCPWCAIGLSSLEKALARLEGEIDAEFHFQPFELNPQMGPGGQNAIDRASCVSSITFSTTSSRTNVPRAGSALIASPRRRGG